VTLCSGTQSSQIIVGKTQADIHDKSLSSGARLSRSAQESAWLFH
jgi:hypothetical protein